MPEKTGENLKLKMNSMKNVLKSLTVIAVLFLSVGFVNGQQKIGHVNYADIIMATPEWERANEDLKLLDSTKTSELQGMFSEFQRKQGIAQDMMRNRSEANKDSIDAQLQTLGMELEDIQRRLQEQKRLAEQELNERQQQLLAPIHQKVGTAIQAVANEKGYAYVFDISSTNIPYFAGGDDLTADVKTKLGIATQ